MLRFFEQSDLSTANTRCCHLRQLTLAIVDRVYQALFWSVLKCRDFRSIRIRDPIVIKCCHSWKRIGNIILNYTSTSRPFWRGDPSPCCVLQPFILILQSVSPSERMMHNTLFEAVRYEISGVQGSMALLDDTDCTFGTVFLRFHLWDVPAVSAFSRPACLDLLEWDYYVAFHNEIVECTETWSFSCSRLL